MNNTISAVRVESFSKSSVRLQNAEVRSGGLSRSRRALKGSGAIARAIETLEARQLFAVDPGMATVSRTPLTSGSATVAFSNPVTTVDPLDQMKLVTVATSFNSNSPNAPSSLVGQFTLNGGVSWSAFTLGGRITDPSTISTANLAGNPYAIISDVSVGFDRSGSFYVTSFQHNLDGTSGAVVFEKFTLASAPNSAPVETDYDGLTPLTVDPLTVYQWIGQAGFGGTADGVTAPTMTVSTNVASYTDANGNIVTDNSVVAGQTPIYISWTVVGRLAANRNGAGGNPNEIAIVSSNDGGASFGSPRYASAGNFSGNNTRNTLPKIVVSQGTGSGTAAVGGLVNVLWDDTRVANNVGLDTIMSRRFFGATASTSGFEGGFSNAPTILPHANSAMGIITPTTVDFHANLSAASINDLLVYTGASGADLSKVSCELISPSGSLRMFLFNLHNDGVTTFAGQGLTGLNEVGDVKTTVGGVSSFAFLNNGFGVEFSDAATTVINANGVTGSAYGQFGAEDGSLADLAAQATAAGDVGGVWTVRFTNFNTDPGGSVTLSGALVVGTASATADPSLTTGGAKTVATTSVRQGEGGTNAVGVARIASPNSATAAVLNGSGYGPGVVAAVDNTLDKLARHSATTDLLANEPVNSSTTSRGRIYVAYTGRNVTNDPLLLTPINPVDNTDIFLVASDDGGVTWTSTTPNAFTGQVKPPLRVNDDDGLKDGFSDAAVKMNNPVSNTLTAAQLQAIRGRPQFEPAITVDQTNGNVVMSWYDARWDSARVRVATYVGVSTNGGSSFTQSYANTPNAPTDAISGVATPVGPIPENFGSQNPSFTNFTFAAGTARQGIGTSMGLAAAGGRIYPVWVGNDNGGTQSGTDVNQIAGLGLRTAVITAGGGPRIIASDMGPVVSAGVATAVKVSTVDPTNPALDTITTNNYNSTFDTTDGRRLFSGFTVTFDREILASSFQPGAVQVWYRPPSALGTAAGTSVAVGTIVPLYANHNEAFNQIATKFLVNLTTPQSSVGTYSYSILPADAATSTVPTIKDTSIYFGLHNYGVDSFANVTTNAVTGATTNAGTGLVTAVGTGTDVAFLPGVPATQIFLSGRILVSGTVGATGDLSKVRLALTTPGGTSVIIADFGKLSGTSLTNQVFSLDGLLPLLNPPPAPAARSVRLIKETIANNWTLTVFNSNTATASITTFKLQLVTADSSTAAPAVGNALDQNRDGRGGLNPQFDMTGTNTNVGSQVSLALNDLYAAPSPTTGTTAQSDFSVLPSFDSDSRPIIVPGPYLTGVTPVLSNTSTGTVTNYSSGSINGGVVVNGTTNAVDLTFDRDIDPASFTAAAVLNITGPNGTVNGPTRYTSADQNVAIPDKTILSPVRSSTITVNDTYPIGNVSVQLSITHANLSELRITLLSPSGKTVALVNPISQGNPTGDLAGANLTNTLFDAAATLTINDKANSLAPYQRPAGYQPTTSGSANSLSDLTFAADANSTAKGNWTLIVEDTKSGTVGVLNYWSLIITPDKSAIKISQPLPPSDPAYNRTYRVTFPTQRLSGNYTVTLAPTLSSKSTHELLDSSQDAGLNRLRSAATGSPQTVTYTANTNNVPKVITNSPTTPISSSIFVPDLTSITDVKVQLNISYPNDPDLRVELVAKDGTVVPLFANVGATGSKANFQDTVFSASATTPIGNGAAPFLGTYKPTGDITQLLVGKSMGSGFWTLNIYSTGATPASTVPHSLNSWNLTISTATTSNNLGDPAADQVTAGFRIYQFSKGATGSPQSSNEWTPMGPQPANVAVKTTTGATASVDTWVGRIGGVAVDTSDPTGNTVFAAGAGGGVWKTRNFLTTDPAGPSWIPLTDLGPNTSLNIGSIAVFPRNSDPNQTIIIAGTGEADSGTTGIGFLRSFNGGQTWQVLDSKVNVDSTGAPLPLNQNVTLPTGAIDKRTHDFLGTTTYRVLVDPRLTPAGDVVIWAAMGGDATNAGIWRSNDSGNTWTRVKSSGANAATDVSLDLNSGYFDTLSNPTGNLQYIYAAFQNDGVYFSPNRGATWSQLLGGVGNPLKVDPTRPGSGQIATDLPTDDPNGIDKQRITLARPALLDPSNPSNTIKNILYQGWMYVLVAKANSIAGQAPSASDLAGADLDGIYMTKDFGQNWTKLALHADRPYGTNVQTGTPYAGALKDIAIPTNDTNATAATGLYTDAPMLNSYFEDTGNDNQSLAVDPSNPAILYVGGENFYRVDTTAVYDAHALYLNDSANDGGQLHVNSVGPATLTLKTSLSDLGTVTIITNSPTGGTTTRQDPILDPNFHPFINLTQNPFDPFNVNSTIVVGNVTKFTNTGAGVKWTPFAAAELNNSTGHHELIATIDPASGRTRLIMGDDQGIFTGVYNADGTSYSSTSQKPAVVGARGGNLSIAQLYYGAVDPGLASQVAAATGPQKSYFYTGAKDSGGPRSTAGVDVLDTGNLSWNSGPNAKLGGGVAVDQTGLTGAYYNFFAPAAGVIDPNFPTNPAGPNFFFVNDVSSVSGLLQSAGSGSVLSGDPQWPDYMLTNFGINPINGKEAVIASATGRIFATSNQGKTWSVIANPGQINLNPNTVPADKENPKVPAFAYGAPDPALQGNQPGATGNIVYLGTAPIDGSKGQVWLTLTGGGSPNGAPAWISLDAASLDGSAVQQIVASPLRGSHDVYVVTQLGVYFMTYSVTDPNAADYVTKAKWTNITNSLNSVNGYAFNDPNMNFSRQHILTSIQADWRYRIPDAAVGTNAPTGAHPVLYVSGDGGVFRSTNNGKTWTSFPSVAEDGSIADSGQLPNVVVSDLDLAVGPIDPVTGYADSTKGENLLMASTFGRGTFAIRVAPIVTQITTADANRADALTFPNDYSSKNPTPTFTGYSEATAFGNKVIIRVFDLSDPNNATPPEIDVGNAGVVTDNAGHFSIKIDTGKIVTNGKKYILGVQATQVDANNNVILVSPITKLNYTLDTTPPAAPVITGITPDTGNGIDTGTSGTLSDGKTANSQPQILGSGEIDATLNITIKNNATGALVTGTTGVTVDNLGNGSWNFTPPAKLADGVYTVTATQTDVAGNVSPVSTDFTLTIITAKPATPAAPTLLAADDTGTSSSDGITSVTSPHITGTTTPGGLVSVFSGATLLGTTTANATTGAYSFLPPTPFAAGTYNISVKVTNEVGNISNSSPVLKLQIITTAPSAPTTAPVLLTADDSGKLSTDGVTNVTAPHYNGTATANNVVDVYVSGVLATTTTVSATGTYSFQLPTELDGSYTIAVKQKDLAGNTSGFSPAAALIIDTAAPVVSASGVTGQKNVQFSDKVATYTDTNPGGPIAITWGDGHTSAGTDTGGTPRIVTGTNTFARSGTFNYAVQVTDLAGNTGTATGTATVTGIAVTPTGGKTINATEAVPFTNQTVATFVDSSGSEIVSAYSASIDWGDGTALDTGVIQYVQATDSFVVLGSHRYGEDGTYDIHVIVTTGGQYPSVQVTSTAIVVNTPVTLTPAAFTGTAGQSFTTELATFLDGGDNPQASDFSGSIAWGDGTTTPIDSITQDATNPKLFHVIGTHTYAEGPATYNPVITVLNKGTNPAQATATGTIANGLPTVAVNGQATVFSGTNATFTFSATDPSPSDVAAGFTYIIDWGDGTTPLTVNATPGNGTATAITKSYAAAGTFTISVTATDRNGGVSAPVTKTVAVAAAPVITNPVINGGAFNPNIPLNDINTINFNIASATAGTTLPQLTSANLVLVRDGFTIIPLGASPFTFNTATGDASLDVSALNLADGDYELQVNVPNAPSRSVNFSRLAGDFNGDSIVDGKDTALLKKALGKTEGQPGFIPGGDFSGNGVIDKDDQTFLKTLQKHRLSKSSKLVKYDPRKPLQKIPALSFSGKVGDPITAQDVVIQNLDTTRAVSLTNILFTGATGTFAFKVIGQAEDATTATIPAGGKITLRVYFNPTTKGTQTASATFGIAFAGNNPQFVVVQAKSKVK